jgi:hypothetical protein
MEEGQGRVAQCCGMTPAIPHIVGNGSTAAGLSTQRRDQIPDSRAVSRIRRGGDLAFDRGACDVTGHLMLWFGGVGEMP